MTATLEPDTMPDDRPQPKLSKRKKEQDLAAIARNQKATAVDTTLATTGVRDGGIVTIGPEGLSTLNVDESYQRGEITRHVNTLIAVLQQGATIHDPITVAVRPDGSRWIVDGQQRYWAHWHTGKPIRAHLLHVPNVEAEKALFSAYNSSVRLLPGPRIKAWPGPSGRLIHWINESPESPIRTEVSFVGGGAHYPAMLIMRALYVALAGSEKPETKVEHLMRQCDRVVSDRAKRAEQVAQNLTLLWKQLRPDSLQDGTGIKSDSRMPRGHVIALALACHTRWDKAPAGKPLPMPDPVQMGKLKRMNWQQHSPGNGEGFVVNLCEQILRRWTA